MLQESSLRKPDDLVCKIVGNRDPHHFLWPPPHLWVILFLTMGIYLPS